MQSSASRVRVLPSFENHFFLCFAVGGPGLLSRLQSCAVSVFLAGLAGYPIGHLQVQFKEQRSPKVESQGTSVPNEGALPYPVRNYDVVGAVINKLDASLKDPKNV